MGWPPRDTLGAMGLAVILVVGTEVLVRGPVSGLGKLPDYWDARAASRFEYYRLLVQEARTPTMLVVGDSTAARDLDVRLVARESGVDSGLNIGWPANFPMALECTTLPLLRLRPSPRFVVLSLSPKSLTDLPRIVEFEAGVLSSPICKEALGGATVSRNVALTRLRRSIPYLVDEAMRTGATKPPPMMGFMPLGPVKKGEGNVGTTSSSNGPLRLSGRRLAVISEIARVLKHNNSTLIVVIPPTSDNSATVTAVTAVRTAYRSAMDAMQSAGTLRLVDGMSPESPGGLSFYDWDHLDAAGAAEFSLWLGRKLRPMVGAGPRVLNGQPGERERSMR